MIWCMLDQVEKMAMLFYGGVFTSRIPLNSLLPSMRNKEYTVTTWISGWHYYHSCQGAGAKSCIFGVFFLPSFFGGSRVLWGLRVAVGESDQQILRSWSPFWTCSVCSDLGSHLTAWQPFWECVWQALRIRWHCLNRRLVKNSPRSTIQCDIR